MKGRWGTLFVVSILLFSVQGTAGAAEARGGSGRADLAIGVPLENIGSVTDAGAVDVLYGSSGGLDGSGGQLWDEDTVGGAGGAHTEDLFGNTLAAGDFNGDGVDDLAMGIPHALVGGLDEAGAVYVMYGAADGSGLATKGSRIWTQDSPNVLGEAEAYDWFGVALAAGDFDGDGYDDLAVGVYGEAVGSIGQAGAVNILYGSTTGLTSSGNQLWDQDSAGVPGEAEAGDFFGAPLASGNFDGDGYDDLAVGVTLEDVGTVFNSGAVNVLYGSAAGLTATDGQEWDQDKTDMQGTAEANDEFGSALTAGDFDGDGRDDLAIGVPYEDVNVSDDGAVSVLYGTTAGLAATANQLWSESDLGVTGIASDYFGDGLAAGDFDADGRDDLAVGAPLRTVGAAAGAGVVYVVYGSASHLTSAGHLSFSQSTTGDPSEADDHFGTTLAAGDLDGDGYADLAVDAPWENVGTLENAGGVSVVFGSAAGLATAQHQYWTQDKPGVPDRVEALDNFGSSLAIGDFGWIRRMYLPSIVRHG